MKSVTRFKGFSRSGSLDSATAGNVSSCVLGVDAIGLRGGPTGDLRISIRGWAVASDPISEISAVIDGRRFSAALLGSPDPAISRMLSEDAGKCAFLVQAELADRPDPQIEAKLVLHTASGMTVERPINITIPPSRL